ncbi:MAG: PepSY domain-containing protein [Rhizobiales bacterium]|nr:PepSY domain-containing protein [Hyphomicrobiales bacterium]OJY46550.1 MAG: peptidase [Rhizobiales bacterium 64-17]
MKPALTLAALLMMSAGVALADQPGPDWMSVEQAKAALKQHGYTNVTTIEADDGHYEGVGVKNGQVYEFHLDPRSGKLTKDRVKRND